MQLRVRKADLERDRDQIVGLLARYLNPAYGHRRFSWLYTENPAGPGVAWLAVDTETGSILGTAGACPRILLVGGREVKGWVLTDFCMVPELRTLGPALRLQRTCLAGLTGSPSPIWYDFPSASMLAVYARLGMKPAFHLRRMAKVLSIEHMVEPVLRVPALVRAVTVLGDMLLSLRARGTHRNSDMHISSIESSCDEEFTTLARTTGDALGSCVFRSAAYLNWRYLANPIQTHEIVVARRAGTLVGYCVVTQTGGVATLVDMFSLPSANALPDLLAHVTVLARSRGLAALNASIVESHPWTATLRQLAFTPRETGPVIASGLSSGRHDGTGDAPGCFLTYGDRDS